MSARGNAGVTIEALAASARHAVLAEQLERRGAIDARIRTVMTALRAIAHHGRGDPFEINMIVLTLDLIAADFAALQAQARTLSAREMRRQSRWPGRLRRWLRRFAP